MNTSKTKSIESNGIQQARALLESITEQLTLNDCPNVNLDDQFNQSSSLFPHPEHNDRHSNSKPPSPKRSSTKVMSNQSLLLSRQRHISYNSPTPNQQSKVDTVNISPALAVTSDLVQLSLSSLPSPPNSQSVSTPESLHKRSTLVHDNLRNPSTSSFSRPGSGGEVIMGNQSLATLCMRTLESVSEYGTVISHSQHETLKTSSSDSISSVSYGNNNLWRREVELAPTFGSEVKGRDTTSSRYNLKSEKFTPLQGEIKPNQEIILFPGATSFESGTLSKLSKDDDSEPFDERDLNESRGDYQIINFAHSDDPSYGVLNSISEDSNSFDAMLVSPAKNSCFTNEPQIATSIPSPGILSPASSLASPTTSSLSSKTLIRPQANEVPTSAALKPRIQMFGSEYARHFVTSSAFAPAIVKTKSRLSLNKRYPSSLGSKNKLSKQSPSASMMTQNMNDPTQSAISTYDEASMKSSSAYNQVPRHQGGSTASSSSAYSSSVTDLTNKIINIEDAPESVLSAAIIDIVVTHGSEPPPKGFYRVSYTSEGTDFGSLKIKNRGKKNTAVYLNVMKEPRWERAVQRPCVTALAVIYPDRNEFVPPGFCVVRRNAPPPSFSGSDKSSSIFRLTKSSDSVSGGRDEEGEGSSGNPANLNYGTTEERVYLCYRRSREGNPITGIIPLLPSNNECIPEGYTVVERTPRNFVADINFNCGPVVFLAFRQRLANLETLRPLPLVTSVHRAIQSDIQKQESGIKSKIKGLKAYYCTGGTVVYANVGLYHVMDRSRHPLVSPSSVSNRISLIQASRLKRTTSVNSYSGDPSVSSINPSLSGTSENDCDGPRGGVPRSPSPMTLANCLVGLNNIYISSDKSYEEVESCSSNVTEDTANGLSYKESNKNKSQSSDSRSFENKITDTIFMSKKDAALQACFDVMEFIPTIQCANKSIFDKYEVNDLDILLQSRIAVITPILTACYTHHGGSALTAVEGLTKLLTETNFFLPDVALPDDPFSKSRVTLLDLAVQVVCDLGNSSARETVFLPCIEFLSEAIFYAKGNLSDRTIGHVYRFYFFVFFFGASIPTKSSWPKFITEIHNDSLNNSDSDERSDRWLLSDPGNESKGGFRSYLEGGAPQAAALALKDLITICLNRLKKMNLENIFPSDDNIDSDGDIESYIAEFVSTILENSVNQVDAANFTQLAINQIHRSGGSELFWYDMLNSCGSGLFPESSAPPAVRHYFITTFSILASLTKVASGKLRKISKTTRFVPRDVASKLLSLELLLHFLHAWRKAVASAASKLATKDRKQWRDGEPPAVTTMAYTIRRLIVPCLLSNTRMGLEDIKVFRRIMKIVTELWCTPYFRQHIKIEIGVLIEHFVLRLLRLGPQVLPPKKLSNVNSYLLNELPDALLPHQVCVIHEIIRWFSAEPRDVLELFLNFDQVDAHSSKNHLRLLPSTHWKITQQLCECLSTVAEQCTDMLSDQIKFTRRDLSGVDSQPLPASNHSNLIQTEEDLKDMTLVREGARQLQEECLHALSLIAKAFMLCAAATSGANSALLTSLRKKNSSNEMNNEKTFNGIKMQINDNADDNSVGSAVKSVSTIGAIVGVIVNNKLDHNLHSEEVAQVQSSSHSPTPEMGTDDKGDIVEYWQTAIAAERRKNMSQSTALEKPKASNHEAVQKDVNAKPPLPQRPSRFSDGTRTNLNTLLRSSVAPSRGDDASMISFNSDSLRVSQKVEDILEVAFEIIKNKSLQKGLDYLTACNFLSTSARDIANFLRLHRTNIDSASLGEYLGEGGRDGDDVLHFNLLRFSYFSAISFVGMKVEQGLRHFLTNCGFRLPGEAQKIDRIMTTFAQCYWEDNAGDSGCCPFQDQDTVFLISFAIIMLNTDLHKTSMFAAPPGQTVSKQKLRKKMTKPEFINNLKGAVDNTENLSREYLSEIYDSIATNPIAIYRPPETSKNFEPSRGRKIIQFVSNDQGNHIIQGNIDISGMLKHWIKSVKPSQELLRSLASHEHPYLHVRNSQDRTNPRKKDLVPEPLVRAAYNANWHYFHGVINSALDVAHLDPKGLENILNLLMYSLCATICLDLSVERNAFACQLVRVKFFRENRGLKDEDFKVLRTHKSQRTHNLLDYKSDAWYVLIEKAAESYAENSKVTALDEVDKMFQKLQASLKVDTTFRQEMIRVSMKIRQGQVLLNDPTRYFVKEGLLWKKCNRTGRNTQYTFFLFSDVLIYASESNSQYKIHGELPLHLMKIMNIANAADEPADRNSKQKRTFHLIHPKKSFLCYAETFEEKEEWVKAINDAISREVKRKARIEGARKAAKGN